jgi:hypothetical protein
MQVSSRHCRTLPDKKGTGEQPLVEMAIRRIWFSIQLLSMGDTVRELLMPASMIAGV